MRITIFFIISIFIFSCSTKEPVKTQQVTEPTLKQQQIDTIVYFTDSVEIANKRNSKVSLAIIRINDSVHKSSLRYFSKEKSSWKLSYSFEDDHYSGDIIQPEIADFNNDGYKDFKYLTGTGARGGNGIYNLFIFDKKGDSLVFVLNSKDYPNLYYNRETNSINSYILTGSNETVFMHLNDNILKPFASIDQNSKYITISEYDIDGSSKIIKEDSSGKYEEFANFINYKPLKAGK